MSKPLSTNLLLNCSKSQIAKQTINRKRNLGPLKVKTPNMKWLITPPTNLPMMKEIMRRLSLGNRIKDPCLELYFRKWDPNRSWTNPTRQISNPPNSISSPFSTVQKSPNQKRREFTSTTRKSQGGLRIDTNWPNSLHLNTKGHKGKTPLRFSEFVRSKICRPTRYSTGKTSMWDPARSNGNGKEIFLFDCVFFKLKLTAWANIKYKHFQIEPIIWKKWIQRNCSNSTRTTLRPSNCSKIRLEWRRRASCKRSILKESKAIAMSPSTKEEKRS